METKEAKPEVNIKLAQDTDIQDRRILGGKITFDKATGGYEFILDSEFISEPGIPKSFGSFFSVKLNHN
jgi:hypothetical protein